MRTDEVVGICKRHDTGELNGVRFRRELALKIIELDDEESTWLSQLILVATRGEEA